jgi:thiamine biosynthesis lipoprotein
MALHSFPFDALGTECIIHLCADSTDAANTTASAVIDEVARIEYRYSRYRNDSTLSEINRAAARGDRIEIDNETGSLLDYAFACHSKSDGLFDITSGILRKVWDFASGMLPTESEVTALLPRIGLDKLVWEPPYLGFLAPGIELDFGGIGKEYAADRAAEVCSANCITHAMIDLGGDIRVLGPQADGSPWRVGIRDPKAPSQAIAIVELSSGALATSGDYERYIDDSGKRYSHILDPHTGWPAHGLSSVSIHAEQCLFAGSLATIAMLKGEGGKDWLAALGIEHLWVDDKGRQGGPLARCCPG